MQHFTFTTKEVAGKLKIRDSDLLKIIKHFNIGFRVGDKGSHYRFTHGDIYRLEELLKGGE